MSTRVRIMVTTRHSNQQGSKSVQISSFLPGPTIREHRKLIGVKTMSPCLWVRTIVSAVWSAVSISESELMRVRSEIPRRISGVLQLPRDPPKVIKVDSQSFPMELAIHALHGRRDMRHFTRNGTDQCQNGSSNFLTSMPRATPIDSDCCRLPTTALLATKRTNHAPISFDQQAL